MTSDVNLFRVFSDNYEGLLSQDSDFLDIFYKYFVHYSNDIEKIFNGIDLERQKGMLRSAITELGAFFKDGKLTPYLSSLAETHRIKLNVTPSMYHSFCNALNFSLKVNPHGTPKDLSMALRVVLAPGIEFMKYYRREHFDLQDEIYFHNLFDASFKKICDREKEFTNLFYSNFINYSVEIKSIFEGVDIEKQKTMLIEGLKILSTFSRQAIATEQLRYLAIKHREDSEVRSYMYLSFVDVLMASLQDIKIDLSHQDELAWRIVLSPGIEFMKYHE